MYLYVPSINILQPSNWSFSTGYVQVNAVLGKYQVYLYKVDTQRRYVYLIKSCLLRKVGKYCFLSTTTYSKQSQPASGWFGFVF